MISRRTGLALFACVCVFLAAPSAYAQSASELKAQIDARNAQIAALEAEIAEYQRQVDALGAKRTTLQSAISTLTLSQKQLAAQIRVTQTKIASANLEIQQLTLSIGDKEASIAADRAAVAKALRSLAQEEERPLIARLAATGTLGEAWEVADQTTQFNRALGEHIKHLEATRTALAENRDRVSETKKNLVALNTQLTLQKRSVDANKAEQQKLLAQTKNQESNYQTLIARKLASQKSFEQELVNLQSQLDLVVNPRLLPRVGSGVLSWPFPLTFMNGCASRQGFFGNRFCITQYFGNTPFSTANPQIYNGRGHNAIDIAAPIGTPIVAAMEGAVLGTGNTDLAVGCYSFGKWVMVRHDNGLSTLYAHLSVIDVAGGQHVGRGQVIGLSGMTGYATGPHIHFGVYASEGTQITTLRQFRGTTLGCADATLPVATLTAYLNPLSYL